MTGLPISTYFSGVKLLWLMENVKEIREAVADGTCCFGTVDSWIIYNLTNKAAHVTDGRTPLDSLTDVDHLSCEQ